MKIKSLIVLVIILSTPAFSGCMEEKPSFVGYFVINDTAYDVTLLHRAGGHELNILEHNQSRYIQFGHFHNAYVLNNALIIVEERDYHYVYSTVLYENGKFVSKPIPVPQQNGS